MIIRDPSPRDYPEDFKHENGNYMCKCVLCDNIFMGHKRRVVCKVCFDTLPTTENPITLK